MLERSPHTASPAIFDKVALLRRIAGDQTLLHELLDEFTREYADCAQTLRHLSAGGAQAAATRLAHAIKGAAANLGADEICALVATAEGQLRAGADLDPAILAELEQAWQRWREVVGSERGESHCLGGGEEV